MFGLAEVLMRSWSKLSKEEEARSWGREAIEQAPARRDPARAGVVFGVAKVVRRPGWATSSSPSFVIPLGCEYGPSAVAADRCQQLTASSSDQATI